PRDAREHSGKRRIPARGADTFAQVLHEPFAVARGAAPRRERPEIEVERVEKQNPRARKREEEPFNEPAGPGLLDGGAGDQEADDRAKRDPAREVVDGEGRPRADLLERLERGV